MHAQSLSCVQLFWDLQKSLPGSSVHGTFYARILKWVAIFSSRGSSLTQESNPCLLHSLHWQAGSLPLSHLGSLEPKIASLQNKILRWPEANKQFSLVQFSRSVVSDSLRSHGLQHARPPCPSRTPGVYSNSCPLSRWCHPTISFSVIPSLPAFNLSQYQGLFK